MTRMTVLLAAATLLAADSAQAEGLAPVAVAQADTMGGLATAQTATAAGIVVIGALIVENADSDGGSDTVAATGT